jgi:Dolichyl-phosphate-mannose-protein mannosyltransferase
MVKSGGCNETMGQHIPYESRSDYATVALLILIAGLFCFDVFILIYGINNGINDFHGFRQSQTALTAYWLDREPHVVAYITPVLGYPWSVPFEYPVYQWIVVLLMKVGVPLVVGGRIVSFAAFVACLVPLKVMARDFNVPNRAFFFVAVVYLACPFYIFWSRTFMIETTALLFSLCWLAGFVRFGRSPSVTLWLATVVFGFLAALTKSITFLSIGPVAGALFLTEAFSWLRKDRTRRRFLALFARGALCLIPLATCYAWVVASDLVKSANPFGLYLESTALLQWNFGTLAQRFTLGDTIIGSLGTAFGYAGLLTPLLICMGLINNSYRRVIVGSIAAYVSAFLIFTNLHVLHTYYQVSNTVFACVAIGISIASIMDKGWHKVAAVVLVCILISQAQFFREFFWRYIQYDNVGDPMVLTAQAARDATKSNESLLFLGENFSSVVPFYSERKSLGVVPWASPPLFDKMISNPQSLLGDAPLGGIIDCRHPLQTSEQTAKTDAWLYSAEQTAKIDAFLANRRTVFHSGRCRLMAPDRG